MLHNNSSIIILVSLLIYIVIASFLLHLATKMLKFQRKALGLAFLTIITTVILVTIIKILLSYFHISVIIYEIVGLIVAWYIIKKIYGVGWLLAIVAWLLSILIAYIVAFILILLIGAFIGITFAFYFW